MQEGDTGWPMRIRESGFPLQHCPEGIPKLGLSVEGVAIIQVGNYPECFGIQGLCPYRPITRDVDVGTVNLSVNEGINRCGGAKVISMDDAMGRV